MSEILESLNRALASMPDDSLETFADVFELISGYLFSLAENKWSISFLREIFGSGCISTKFGNPWWGGALNFKLIFSSTSDSIAIFAEYFALISGFLLSLLFASLTDWFFTAAASLKSSSIWLLSAIFGSGGLSTKFEDAGFDDFCFLSRSTPDSFLSADFSGSRFRSLEFWRSLLLLWGIGEGLLKSHNKN